MHSSKIKSVVFTTLFSTSLIAASHAVAGPLPSYKIIVNEFYRGGDLNTGDEWMELLLLQDLTAAEINSYFAGDSTGTTAAKFSGYQFTGMEGIAGSFCAGTIITVAGDAGPAADGSYNPSGGDWNLTLKTSGSNLNTNGSTGNFAGTDVAYIDTDGTNGNSVLTADGFAVNWDSTPGVFGGNATLTITAPSNNSGALLNDDIANAHLNSSWASSQAVLTPGNPNGGANSSSISTLRNAFGTISVSDVMINEGDAGATSFTFTITRSNNCLGGTVWYHVDPTGANPVDAADFSGGIIPPEASVNFNPGESSKMITININGDTTVESDEQFLLSVTDNPILPPEGGPTTLATAIGTILNDDAPTTISIDDVTQNEGNAGTSTFDFTVSITPGFVGDISVDFTTADDTATTADPDYVATSGTVNFSSDFPNTTTQIIPVTVNGDLIVENDETFFVNLSNVNGAATISDNQGVGTITNDDFATLSIDNVTLNEGDAGTTAFDFTVSISNPANASVDVNTQDGTATLADNDYQPFNQTINFTTASPTSQTVTVLVNGDAVIENDESFDVTLNNASGATVATGTGTGTILNDDNIQAILSAVKSVSGNLIPGGTVTYTIVITNTGPNPQNDNPGDEMTDILPDSLTFTGGSASSGTLTNSGNAVSWNGSIAANGSVTIVINADINPNAVGEINNQAQLFFDNDGNNTNESNALSNIAGFFIPYVIPSIGITGLIILSLLLIGFSFRRKKSANLKTL